MTKEDISITYENNVFYCTKNGTKWISVDGEKWYVEEKRIEELEQQIADIKANCDLAIEGRDIKIQELEDQLAEEVELHLHAEDYIKSLEQQYDRLEDQLTKAKESIKDLYFIIQSRIDYKDNIQLNDAMERAKQFLEK